MLTRRIKFLIASLGVLLCLAPAVPVMADDFDPFEGACNAATDKSSPACTADGSDPLTGKNGIIYKVSQILAFVAALAAVIMIIVGGLMYVTAGGDSNKVNSSRQMIVAAVIGLVVIAVAELIIALVINLVN